MNVRFFAGTKADYLSLPSPRNPLGLYFCADTKELFWADRLLTDGTRIVATEADLPSLEKAADGITYFVEETRNGYVLSADKTKWIQVIYAPESGSAVKAISFAGIEMEEVDGVFTIDRRCAREALGFKVPEGLEDEEIIIATEDFVKEEIAKIEIPGANLDNYATKQYVSDAIEAINPVVEEVKTKLEEEVLPKVEETILPTVQKVETEILPTVKELKEKAATQDWVEEQGYLTEHQDLSEYAKKSELPAVDGLASEEFVIKKIAEAELADQDVDLSAYYTKSEVDALIPDVSGLIKEIPAEYITESELEAKGYLTEHQSLEGYAKVSDLPSVEGLASESYVDEKVAAIEIPEVPVKVSELENDAKYATEEYVDNAISTIEIPTIIHLTSLFESANAVVEDITLLRVLNLLQQNKEVALYINGVPLKIFVGGDNNHNISLTPVEYTIGGSYVDIDSDGNTDLASASFKQVAYSYYFDGTTWRYASRNPLDSILFDNLPTKHYVDNAIADIPETDLANYYNKTETENLITEAVEAIEHPTVDLSDYTTKDYVAATAHQNKYEVLPIEGMLIQYRDGEIRLNTQRVVPTHQNVGTTGNSNMYYATFRAFAPEGATQCKEGLNGNIDAEYSTLATDEYGRKYTTIWAAIASYNGTSWSLFGANSNLDKYLGFYYHFEWYNEDILIGTDKVRVILTNDTCHDDLIPDAIARRIDGKVSSIEVVVNNITEQVQNIQENYVSNTILEEKDFVTSTRVTELVTTEVSTVVNEQIETKVTEVIEQKVKDGEITVNADAISYGDFEDDIV